MGLRQRSNTDGSVKWEAYSSHGGRNKYLGSYDSKREAAEAIADWEAKAREWKRAIARGDTPTPLHDVTYGDACKEWLAHLQTPGVDGHRSRRKYADQARLHILPTFAKTPLNAVTPQAIVAWQKLIAAKTSPATANTVLIAFSSSLTYCVDTKRLVLNPAFDAIVEPFDVPRREFQWIQSRGDVTKLLVAALGISRDLHDFVAIAIGTGMRLGEILALQWSDVWLDRRLINVHRSTTGVTKSGKARRIPILDAALPVFQARKIATGGQGLVFAPTERQLAKAERLAKAKDVPFNPATVYRERSVIRAQLDSAVIRAKIHQEGMPKLRIHDLRHTFASHWVMDGGDIYRLSKVLGHATVTITEDFYAHLKPDAWKEDYHRVSFKLPTVRDNVRKLREVQADGAS